MDKNFFVEGIELFNDEMHGTKWGDPCYEENSEEFIERMEDQGYEIIYPAPNELLIDLDTEEDWKNFKSHFYRLRNEFPEMKFKDYPSKSGLPRRHVRVTMPFQMDNLERIAWQAVLCSDPVRELLSMIRWKAGYNHPTLFCEPKKEDNNG